MTTFRTIIQLFVRITCSLLIFAMASATPNYASERDSASIDLTQYILPDGTIPVICNNTNSTDANRGIPEHGFSHCADCLSGAYAGLLGDYPPGWLIQNSLSHPHPLRFVSILQIRSWNIYLSRGPPVS